jgi:uncharacterized protein
MSELTSIPLFPLSLLPIPGELVPLHIFEPRYRQLLVDLERFDITFGIFCNHELNGQRIGSLMKLESVIKKYGTGDSDIILRCIDLFSMYKMFRTFRDKSYPGGQVRRWYLNTDELAPVELYPVFNEYQKKRNITKQFRVFSLYQIAVELNLDLFDRYKFLTATHSRQLLFLLNQLKFNLHVLDHEARAKDHYHLN